MFTFIFCSSGPPARELSVIAARCFKYGINATAHVLKGPVRLEEFGEIWRNL